MAKTIWWILHPVKNRSRKNGEALDNDLATTGKKKVILTLNKPVYVVICILDLSKVLVYESHYDYIKNKYGNNSRLLFTDTDSLKYEIKADDVYDDFSMDKEMFAFSNYSAKSKYYDDSDNDNGVAI